MSHRFFIPAEQITPPLVTLPGDIARQVRTVLRLRPGDEIVLLDNSGLERRVRLTQVGQTAVAGEIIAAQPAAGEPALRLSLYQATLKGSNFEWALQKGTELGIFRFIPILCRRSIPRDPQALTKKQSRWRQIIREAAEQSGRGKLPVLEPALPFPEAISAACRAADLVLVPWEQAKSQTLAGVLNQSRPGAIALFIGPEGGFEAGEIDLARSAGAQIITLGPRLLRAETAGLALSAALLYALGEWNPG